MSRPGSWNDPARDKLWLYNLHYFDDLNTIDASERVNWHRDLIQRWVKENPPTAGNGWEPYPLSLRIVNWIKWALQDNAMEPAWLDSLAMQVWYLRKRLEYHLPGNHFIANAKALVFAGLFFDGDEAEKWLAKGLSILEREVGEQVLGDGGHFELSPMYHSIILEDLLDLVNLMKSCSAKVEFAGRARSYVRLMLGWLLKMCHPDGRIGFFNDAAFGIGGELGALLEYATRLGFKVDSPKHDGLTHLSDSGYIRIQRNPVVALLDVAPIGPDYLPGHAHADTLSFELSLFGRRCIVNSGTSRYGDSEERLRQRGTAAHSTVEIDGENSSEVWGGFRVARRARPFALSTEETDQAVSVTCSHDGYKRLKGRPVHTRQWHFEPGRMVVTDHVQGGFRQAVAYYHFHPDAKVRVDDGQGYSNGRIELDGGRCAKWSVTGGQVSIEGSTYHPEFGLSISNQVIKIEFTGPEAVFTLQWDGRVTGSGNHQG